MEGSQLNVNLQADPPVIRSYEDINASSGPQYTSYNLGAEQLACGGTTNMRFWGAAFNWSRVITPAPAFASFSDVGTGYWAFQAIEALADSGITTGYADGTFRPENTVTRAQMATFLARALGLHWPG